ncbi:MAG: hypothetical protein P4L53_22175 [Candidatus Obscuribacterales bacterium]|nr:hypothetical protein [Candidatus Obscuribacterales bacterium]
MRFQLFFPSFLALFIAPQLEAKPAPDVNSLNFQGVQALKATVDSSDAKHVHYARELSDESWQEIFHIFQTALKIHPGAEETRQNLMVAHR